MAELPVTAILPELAAALLARGMAVLQAAPGAGKTTVVPLDLLARDLVTGRILMLEPRRLAARAAAERMAETLGQAVGQTIGYRIRGETKVSAATRIEVVTEGILTRMLQSDPELSGTGLVIFDEFHERSLNTDLGLALCLEVRDALRPDLKLLVMSATLEAGPVAALMGGAPVITSQGRAFPVETRWLPRPPDASLRLEAVVANAVRQAVAETEGGILVFLPGEGEIRRVESQLADLKDCALRPLYGAMDFAAQRAALAPTDARKIVLATAIAETSLTLPDIRVVIDAGRARRARFDPNSGMSRLVTERVTRAEAEQRRGRAGRVASGVCYRLWTKGEDGALALFPPAEIEVADLTGLALELALWGGADLPFLTPPPTGPMAEARGLFRRLARLMALVTSRRMAASWPACPCIRGLGTCLRWPGRKQPCWPPCWASGTPCPSRHRTLPCGSKPSGGPAPRRIVRRSSGSGMRQSGCQRRSALPDGKGAAMGGPRPLPRPTRGRGGTAQPLVCKRQRMNRVPPSPPGGEARGGGALSRTARQGRPIPLRTWRLWHTPTGSGCGARARPRAGSCRAARGLRWRRVCPCRVPD